MGYTSHFNPPTSYSLPLRKPTPIQILQPDVDLGPPRSHIDKKIQDLLVSLVLELFAKYQQQSQEIQTGRLAFRKLRADLEALKKAPPFHATETVHPGIITLQQFQELQQLFQKKFQELSHQILVHQEHTRELQSRLSSVTENINQTMQDIQNKQGRLQNRLTVLAEKLASGLTTYHQSSMSLYQNRFKNRNFGSIFSRPGNPKNSTYCSKYNWNFLAYLDEKIFAPKFRFLNLFRYRSANRALKTPNETIRRSNSKAHPKTAPTANKERSIKNYT